MKPMTPLQQHIASRYWLNYYAESEKGHLLSLIYGLVKWIERDGADELKLKQNEFVWSKRGQIVGAFPITVSEPTPTFQEMLLKVIERDKEVQGHLQPVSDDQLTFRFKVERE